MKIKLTNAIKDIKEAFRKENRKETIKRLLILSGLLSLIFVVPRFFGIGNEVVLGILFSILVLATWSMAGLTVFKSLFTIGAGFSLIIFIAKSYCDLPEIFHMSNANDSLKSLLFFGFIYIIFLFAKSLVVEIQGDKENKGMLKKIEDAQRGERPFTIVSLYLIFIVLFLFQLFQVIVPIIFNLCVYRDIIPFAQ